jgi:hypothetical protein
MQPSFGQTAAKKPNATRVVHLLRINHGRAGIGFTAPVLATNSGTHQLFSLTSRNPIPVLTTYSTA